MSEALIVFGDKTADEILPIAREQNDGRFAEISKVYFDSKTAEQPEFRMMVKRHSKIQFIIGVVDIRLRRQIEEFANRQGFRPFTVIHSSATIAESASIGRGCFIAPQAVVSVNAIVGDFSIIHIHSSIGHDSELSSHCTILPGARISGEVKLGNGVLIGSNSFVFQKVEIGDNTQVDAMTYVRNNVGPRLLVSSRLPKPIQRLNPTDPETNT